MSGIYTYAYKIYKQIMFILCFDYARSNFDTCLFFCSSMLAELLGSDMSLLSARQTSPRGAKSATAQRKTEELKKWRKEHQNKVKEKYNEELARKRKPEVRPFSSEKALVILVLIDNFFSFLPQVSHIFNRKKS